MRIIESTHREDIPRLDTEDLRKRALIEDLFQSGTVTFAESVSDRLVIGGVIASGQPIRLEAPDELRSAYFLERREVGIVLLSGTGTVVADDERYEMQPHEILYLGMGTRDVVFEGEAVFYFVSAPAHRREPTVLSHRADAEVVPIGSAENANSRTIRKHIHEGGIVSNQLAMGITTLEPGNVWNTLPPHTHERRTELYLYFELGSGFVAHIMGEPRQTRHLIVRDREVVVSPPWSVHFGAGTQAYSFVWSTAGENLTYTDSEPVGFEMLR